MAAIQHPGDQHAIPGYEAHVSAASLKDRIKQHYEIASDYYYSLWYVTCVEICACIYASVYIYYSLLP